MENSGSKSTKITLKEVYEKVIVLQERATLAVDLAKTSTNRFAVVLGLILAFIIFDVALHFYLHFISN